MKKFNLYPALLLLAAGYANTQACDTPSRPKVFDSTEPAIAKELDRLDDELKACVRSFPNGFDRSVAVGSRPAFSCDSKHMLTLTSFELAGQIPALYRALRTEKELVTLDAERSRGVERDRELQLHHFRDSYVPSTDPRTFDNMLDIDKRVSMHGGDKSCLKHTVFRPYTKCIADGSDRTACRRALAEGVNKSLAAAYAAERDAR